MPMHPEDYEDLMEHLREKMGPNKHLACPVCGHGKWAADGPVAMLGYEARTPTGIAQLGKSAMPVAILTCQTCFYVYQFSWLPISKEQDG